MVSLDINGKRQNVDVPGETPLLWTLRDELGLTGSKFGCGMALCGACTVHVDGKAVRSCITPISAVANGKIVTIEAVGSEPVGKALQAAWVDTVSRSAATARPARSCPRPRCCGGRRIPPTPRSTKPWTATFAAAGPTRVSAPAIKQAAAKQGGAR